MARKKKTEKEGVTLWGNVLAQRQNIVDRWTQSGLLNGLVTPKQNNITQLLENQAKQILDEVTEDPADSFFGRKNDGRPYKHRNEHPNKRIVLVEIDLGETDIQPFVFPMVRRVFAQTLATEIVSVQPFGLPSGLLFYMDTFENTTGRPDKHRHRPENARIVLCEVWEGNGKN